MDLDIAIPRRRLRFQSLEEVLDDTRRLYGGPVVQLGNWTLGQVCRHLAQAMRISLDGPPRPLTYPWWHRWLGPLFRGFILRHGLRPGYELGGSAAELLVPAPASPAEGLRELEAIIRRLQAESRRLPHHPVLGAFAREEWDQYHMRHAELHLSFLVPAPSPPEGRHDF